jgi:hypothetical protein
MRVLLVLVLLLGQAGFAAAQSEADRSAVERVIASQIQAFLQDDGPTAYSFAAPGIRAMFPTDEMFMQMVRRGYAPVYRPRSYAFGALTEGAGNLEQIVEIVDAEGEYWTALYTLERQSDGSWKITGCYLLRNPGESA